MDTLRDQMNASCEEIEIQRSATEASRHSVSKIISEFYAKVREEVDRSEKSTMQEVE